MQLFTKNITHQSLGSLGECVCVWRGGEGGVKLSKIIPTDRNPKTFVQLVLQIECLLSC